MRKFIKRFATDIAGYGLIILGLLLGWLPGPGGIPLILAGLGLLAIHNKWARNLLIYLKEKGFKFMEYIFPENPWVKALHDLFALLLIFGALYILTTKITAFTVGIVVALIALALVDFLYNRRRWKNFTNKNKH